MATGTRHTPPISTRRLRLVKQRVEKGDMLITLGAGDVWKVAEEFVKEAS